MIHSEFCLRFYFYGSTKNMVRYDLITWKVSQLVATGTCTKHGCIIRFLPGTSYMYCSVLGANTPDLRAGTHTFLSIHLTQNIKWKPSLNQSTNLKTIPFLGFYHLSRSEMIGAQRIVSEMSKQYRQPSWHTGFEAMLYTTHKNWHYIRCTC